MRMILSPNQKKPPIKPRIPIRSLILNVAPCLHGVDPAHRREIIQELRRALRHSQLYGGQIIDGSKGVHIVWTWGECTPQDTDLTSPAEVSGLLSEFNATQTDIDHSMNPLIQGRLENPLFKEALTQGMNTAQRIKALCHDLSVQTHLNTMPSWQERFNLKAPLTCRFGLCHGKLFNIGNSLNGLSLDVASDMARVAPKGGIAFGPIVKNALTEILKEPGAVHSFNDKKKPKLKNLKTQLIPSAQIECPLWEIDL